MPPRPIRVDFQGQIFTIDHDDADELDRDLIQAQIYSMTNVEPERQRLRPELAACNLDQILTLTEHQPELDLDPQIVLSSIEWQTCCSRIWLGETPAVQPAAVVGDLQVCLPCASSCWPPAGLRPDPSPPGFICQCRDRCLFKSRVASTSERLVDPFRRHLFDALAQWKAQCDRAVLARGNASFQDRIQANLRQIADFEDAENQRRALAVIPLGTLQERGQARGAEALSPRDELVFQLLNWFKNEFFQWVNSPACDRCGKETSATGHTAPSPEERRFGAGITELHRCGSCGNVTRFPRYNHSGKLMETRNGRCGEWAQAFVLCCRALKFDTRFVVDWTDHVWAEVYSEAQQRWVHCDPCENRYDAPLLYEAGWGKKLTYVIAFSVDEVRDVTKRYTAKYAGDVLPRRTACQEDWLATTLDRLNQALHSRNPSRCHQTQQRWERETRELDGIKNCDDAEQLPGRQTGSVEWRRARGELGQKKTAGGAELSPAQLQNLIKAYITQMRTGCGNPDCQNREYCGSAKGSAVQALSQKELLSRSIVAVRDCLDGKLCSGSGP